MKTKSTYSLLMNAASEDKGRTIFEISIYALVVLCMAISGWHFAASAISLPGQNRAKNQPESMIAVAPAQPAPVIVSRG